MKAIEITRPGFSAPGVQTTGAAIVRAIDNAQER